MSVRLLSRDGDLLTVEITTEDNGIRAVSCAEFQFELEKHEGETWPIIKSGTFQGGWPELHMDVAKVKHEHERVLDSWLIDGGFDPSENFEAVEAKEEAKP